MEPVSRGAAARPRAEVAAVIPALNEEEPIGDVVRAVLAAGVGEVIVVDNGSKDRTAERARDAGARVVSQPQPGYGRACAAGVAAVGDDCQVVLFLDGDGSDCPEFSPGLLAPIDAGTHDLVIGSRTRGRREPDSMGPQQIVAGYLAGFLCRLVYGVSYTDMGPFRAIRREQLKRLGMREPTYGWNLEMQMRAAAKGLRILEIPVDHRRRAGGNSKVSGNLIGGIRAAFRILWTFAKVAVTAR
jgi:glycosyltransferase involved in cell wall biosynthesis